TEEHSSGVKPSSSAAYYCPMCPGVESDRPGTCPKCGMALERATPQRPTTRTVYTCPMHPEIEQDHPGDCPKCGMALEPKRVTDVGEDDSELVDMTRRFWVALVLTVPVFVLAMAPMVGIPVHEWIGTTTARWIELLFS